MSVPISANDLDEQPEVNGGRSDHVHDVQEGTWMPFILLSFVAMVWWLYTSESRRAIRLRRSMGMLRLNIKKKFGLRDDTKYKEMKGSGDGANQKYKRQG